MTCYLHKSHTIDVYVCVSIDMNQEMSSIHHELSMMYMPDEEPKARLCKAAMYLEISKYEDACVIYQDMFNEVDELDALYQPYVLNNHGLYLLKYRYPTLFVTDQLIDAGIIRSCL